MENIFKKNGLNVTSVSTTLNAEQVAQIETFKNYLVTVQEFLDKRSGSSATISVMQITLQSTNNN